MTAILTSFDRGYPSLTYWTFNWRKQGGAERMVEISKQEHFYMQEYCGCIYSLRDTNKWRTAKGRPKVILGEKYYSSERDGNCQSTRNES